MPGFAMTMFKRSCRVALSVPFLFWAAVAVAQVPPGAPETPGWVVDQGWILSDEVERTLAEDAAAYEAETTAQVVTVTVETLGGLSVEQYGLQLANAWGIGQAEADNGVLLLVAPNDRRVRIEVGIGLEGVLTDAIAQSIIDAEILPAFRDGDMEGGVVAGHGAILRALGGDYVASSGGDGGKDFLESLLHIILLPFFLIARLFGIGGRSRGGGGGGGGFSGGGGSFGGGGASGSW